MASDQTKHSGDCLCGAVRYEVSGSLRDIVNCHCRMCQRLHGVYGAHSKAQKSQLRMIQSDALIWYESSDRARRGFCQRCGSHLFWDPVAQDTSESLREPWINQPGQPHWGTYSPQKFPRANR